VANTTIGTTTKRFMYAMSYSKLQQQDCDDPKKLEAVSKTCKAHAKKHRRAIAQLIELGSTSRPGDIKIIGG